MAKSHQQLPLNKKVIPLIGLSFSGVLAIVLGAFLWGGMANVMDMTNTESFCIGCHEMRMTVYKEYQESPHFKTASGVVATCPDCHVPKDFLPKMQRKVQAVSELYHAAMGTIDTEEKFNQRRKQLAERVWATMKATDSRECRSCHSHERMAFELQDKRTRKKHDPERMIKRGETCIDCHKGIAHSLPSEY